MTCYVVTLLKSWKDHETLPFHLPKKEEEFFFFLMSSMTSNPIEKRQHKLWTYFTALKIWMLLLHISQHGNAQNVAKLSIGWDTSTSPLERRLVKLLCILDYLESPKTIQQQNHHRTKLPNFLHNIKIVPTKIPTDQPRMVPNSKGDHFILFSPPSFPRAEARFWTLIGTIDHISGSFPQ